MTERIKCTRCLMGFRLENPPGEFSVDLNSEIPDNACKDCGRVFWDRTDLRRRPAIAIVGVRPEDHKAWLAGE